MTEKGGAADPVAEAPCPTVAATVSATEGRPARLPGEIWVLVGTAFLVAIGYGLVSPALPSFARAFGVGISAASAVVSAFAVFRLGFAPFSGRLVNAFGERRTFIAGLLVVAGSTGACAVAHSYWQLLTFRAVGGIGIGEIQPAHLALIGELQEALEHMALAAARAMAERAGLQRVELRPAMATGIHEPEIVPLLHRRISRLSIQTTFCMAYIYHLHA